VLLYRSSSFKAKHTLMGRTYRRDDHHSWGKYNKDRKQKNHSEKYSRGEDSEFVPRKKGKRKFDLTSTEYYEEDWHG